MTAIRRGILGVLAALVVWELGAQLDAAARWPRCRRPPTSPPTSSTVARTSGYWSSWPLSFERVLSGFAFALVLGVPFGLLMATSTLVRRTAFPVFEILRPIPPLAWVPLAILFWPTAGAVDHVRDLPRRLLHGRGQRASAAPSRSTAATCSPPARSAPAG